MNKQIVNEFSKFMENEKFAGWTFDDIADEFVKEFVKKTTDAKVIKYEIFNNYASVLVLTNTNFEAWLDYDFDSEAGEWNNYIFSATQEAILQMKLQDNIELFEIMESAGYNFLEKKGLMKNAG